MEHILEEYGGILIAFLAGVFLLGSMLAMGDDGGILHQFVVTYCSGAV